MKFHEVHPLLLVSGHTRHTPSNTALSQLHAANITCVVCVAPQPDLNLAGALRMVGKTYEHTPLSDGKTIKVGVLTELIDRLIKRNQRTLVHCNAGRNRAGLVASLYLIRQGMPPAEALSHVRTVRPRAVANETFEAFILEQKDE